MGNRSRSRKARAVNLLLFNLAVDRDHLALGFTSDWIDELARHFDRIEVITMFAGRVQLADNVTVHSAGLEHGWSKPRRVLEFYRQLFAALRRTRFDCCFSHMNPLFTLLAGPVLRARGIPQALWYAHNHRSRVLGPALHFADRALASTRTAFPIETEKLRIVGQGIDTDRFRPPAAGYVGDQSLRIITIGRLSQVKNIDLMLRAFARLRQDRPSVDCRFEIVGETMSAQDADYVARCRALAHDLQIDDRVTWSPGVSFSDVPAAFRRGNLFLSANDNGLDKAILEAMASGLAVVAMHPAVAQPLGPCYVTSENAFAAALVT
jgi:glycosyltransferase involved in cell wall biosynthesis